MVISNCTIPVTRLPSLRIVFAIAAQLRSQIHQMDVNTAYLNVPVTNENYIRPPEGSNTPPGIDCFRLI
jgi:hypothetical protein